jgi:glutamyl/glutaminyl-tRNA synthetase
MTDSHVKEIITSETFSKVINTLINDYDNKKITIGNNDNFGDEWKAYMKSLGVELGLKGKNLFHPVRLCLTGRMSGPEIADQIQLACLSEGVVNSSLNAVNLANRIEKLKSFNPETSKNIALDAVENRKKEELLKAKQLEAELAAESIEV